MGNPQRENAMIIDSIRKQINSFPEDYKTYLLAPLLTRASIHTNTTAQAGMAQQAVYYH